MKRSHVNTGIRKILENLGIFNFFNHQILGTNKYLVKFCDRYFNYLGSIKMLDIGCGTADILTYLNLEIDYVGFDMQEEYIEHAKSKFSDRGKFFTQIVDGTLLPEWINKFDVILAHGLLHHLINQDCDVLLKSSNEYLKEDGFMITVDSTYFEGQSKLAKWLVSKDRGQNVRRPEDYKELASKYYPYVDG